jgi:Subtilase family/Secretion system C-terminal sorting domain/Bacterial pre-peptidase C-terminal domain
MKNNKFFIIFQHTVLILILLFCINILSIAQSSSNPSKKFVENSTTVSQISQLAEKLFLSNTILKNNLTDIRVKISSSLLPLIDDIYLPSGFEMISYIESLENASQFVPFVSGYNLQQKISEGIVLVYVSFNSPNALSLIETYAEEIISVNSKFRLAVIRIKVKNLELLASNNNVGKIRFVEQPQLSTGSVVTEGDSVHQTKTVRDTYGYNGTGIKIGVISNGVDSRSSSQATGDLPLDGVGLTVLSNTYGGDEGTAMLEIIHDLVPGAELYFHDLGGDVNSFMAAIDNLVDAGVDIICDDVSWTNQPYFEDGIIAQHINSLLNANDILYLSPAGNSGISHYQGQFKRLSGTTGQHDFSNGTSQTPYLYFNLPVGGNVTITLQWEDKFGQSGNDYDLYLYSYSDNRFVAQSLNYQNGSGNPSETINYTAVSEGDYAIVVNKYSGRRKILETFIYMDAGFYYSNNISAVDAIYGHAALDSVITVGAVNYASPDTIEYFSSLGPSTIKYPNNTIRNKPDLVAVDGTLITGAGGFGAGSDLVSRFYGTSASVAHVAGVLAQVWSHPDVSSGSQAKQYVINYSDDEGQTGFDNTFGYGLVNSLNVYQNPLPVELSSFTLKVLSGGIKLNWVTQTEVNNYGFEVERATIKSNKPDDNHWENIGFVEGNGNSSSPKYYSYIDEGIKYGTYKYRLKQIDNDGTYEFSDQIEVYVGEIPGGFVLEQNYPNPFNPSTRIKFAVDESTNTTLKIYDILGNEIATLFNEITEAGKVYELEFTASELPSGLYIYNLITETKSKSRKMILLK